MPDPATILGLTYLGGKGLDLVSEFVKEIFKPTATVIGEELASPVKAWQERRRQRAGALIIDAAVEVEQSGESAQAVPGRVLWPLLEKGSLEEDDDLRARWVHLLANAATPSKAKLVHPAFVQILSELMPVEAKWLEERYGYNGYEHASMMEVDERRKAGKVTTSIKSVNIANLVRVGILMEQRDMELRLADVDRALKQHQKLANPTYSPGTIKIGRAMQSRFVPTQLGKDFIEACIAKPSDSALVSPDDASEDDDDQY